MLYNSNGSSTSPRVLSGASLAQRVRRMTAPQKACLVADVLDGKIILTALTAKSIATIVGANFSYVHHALRLSSEAREQVKRGLRPLAPVQRRPSPTPAAINWDVVDDATIEEWIRAVGVDRTLDVAAAVESAAV